MEHKNVSTYLIVGVMISLIISALLLVTMYSFYSKESDEVANMDFDSEDPDAEVEFELVEMREHLI